MRESANEPADTDDQDSIDEHEHDTSVEPLSDLDPYTGELPGVVHHLATRGAHPELKHDLGNLIGLAHGSHQQHHDTGAAVPKRPSFYSMF